MKFLRRYGWFGLARLIVYPITTLLTTPIRLMQTLWSTRVILDGRWGDSPHYSAHTAISYLFYWTRALSLYRYGRAGRAPYLGIGDAPLSQLFFYSLPSLYAYWIAPLPTILLGMLGWLLSHMIWLRTVQPTAIFVVMGLALISTMFYVNLARQNYNVVGWMFLPLGLYGLMTGHWVIAGLAWIGASLGGVTTVFVGGIFSLLSVLTFKTFLPIFALFPAALLLGSHFWPLFRTGRLVPVVLEITKAIGFTERKAKYKRADSKTLDVSSIYLLLLAFQFWVVFFLVTGNVSLFLLTGMLIFLVNTTLLRFADPQSMYIMILSVSTAVILSNFDFFLLPSFWLLISPLPKMIKFPTRKKELDVVPALVPFNVHRFLDGMRKFLAPIHKGERVLMAFDDPYGIYENIFDGQRFIVELPLYVAAEREIHLFPDWTAVFQTNYEDAPDFWGRDVGSVQRNSVYWNADYVVIYQKQGIDLDEKWQSAGFELVDKFSWSNYSDELSSVYRAEELTDWWLLKVPVREAGKERFLAPNVALR